MILATTQVEDFDRFEKVFSTAGAEKRKQHGSKGATVFRDPNEQDRVWAEAHIAEVQKAQRRYDRDAVEARSARA